MRKKILGVIIITLLFGVGIFSAKAQEAVKTESCNDYYFMGDLSGNIVISPEEKSTAFSPGQKAKFFIVARNGSKIIIPDVALLLRIEKMGTIKGDKKIDLADRKIIKEEILLERLTLNAGELRQINYELTVPAEIENGIYTIKVFPLRGNNLNIERTGFDFFEYSLIGTCYGMG